MNWKLPGRSRRQADAGHHLGRTDAKRFRLNGIVGGLMAAAMLFSLSLLQPLNAQTKINWDLPFSTNLPGDSLVPLQALVDPAMQAELLKQLSRNPKWKQLIAEKKMAVGVVDLRNRAHLRFARINGDEMMYAASLPKIAILLASMDAIEKKQIPENTEIMNDLRLMISYSDNEASTRMIDRLGYEKIEKVLCDPKYKLYDIACGGGLWVGKRYAADGRRYPDPLKGLSHAASATQVCRFYYMLINGKLVNQKRSKQMLDIMVDPALHHKFVNTLDQKTPHAKLFRKSGSWENFHSDSILVWGPRRKYILVGLIEDPEGEQILRDLVNVIENVLQIPGN
ncbi:MAG: serine hydrolase [Bacteroidia bacterium]